MPRNTIKNNDIPAAVRYLIRQANSLARSEDMAKLKAIYSRQPENDDPVLESRSKESDIPGLSRIWISLMTAAELCRDITADRNMVAAILLFPAVRSGLMSLEELRLEADEDIATLVEGLVNIQDL